MKRLVVVLLVMAAPTLLTVVPSRAQAQDPYGQPGYAPQPPGPQPGYGQPGYAPQGPQGGPAGYDQPPPEQYAQPGEESAMQYGYFGPHPEPYEQGQSVCQIEGPHFHQYPPFDRYLFREANGYFYFIGDLGDFGYHGQMWGYQGNHPLPIEYGGGYCYIDWPHRHPFPPPASMQFSYIGGYYSYNGAWDPAYYSHRAAWVGYFGGYYRTSYFGGRYWSVRPRAIYAPSYGWGARGVYRPGAIVNAPGGLRVTVGRPSYNGGGYGRPGYYGGSHPVGSSAGYYPHAGGGTYSVQSRGGYEGGRAVGNQGSHPVGNTYSHPAGNSYSQPARAAEPARSAPMQQSHPVEMRAPSHMSAPSTTHHH